MDRRTFVKTAGGAAAASMLPLPRSLRVRDHIDKIGVQLYTVRQQMAVSVERTLADVAQIGYKEVEFAGYNGRPPRAIKQLLDDNGLKSPSAHIGLGALRGPWNRTLSDAAEVEHKWLTIASMSRSDTESLDALKKTADLIHKAADDAKFYKIKLAFHNHADEFKEVEGKRIYDHLLELTSPKELDFEMDLYWITRGGGDPLAYFEKWEKRFRLMHLKDATAAPEFRMEDVGKGTINWKEILSHKKQGGFEHYFVEHDNPADPIASLKASYEYLKRLEF